MGEKEQASRARVPNTSSVDRGPLCPFHKPGRDPLLHLLCPRPEAQPLHVRRERCLPECATTNTSGYQGRPWHIWPRGHGLCDLVLERLLPGQRAGASGWCNFAKNILADANFEHFAKEPTLFKTRDPKEKTGLLLHGLLAATEEQKQKFEKQVGTKVTLQMSGPLKEVGDELEFLKRRYVRVEDGVIVFANSKYLEALEANLGPNIKRRDSPSDQSFLEPDNTTELAPTEAKLYKESVGRLMYLAHSRPDVQFPVCILSSKMSAPTALAMKWLHRVVGYLLNTPEIGFLLKPIRDNASYDYSGDSELGSTGTLVVESITDADWAGCRRSRKSRTSLQLYVSGTMVGSAVRSQKSIALSSGESEFVAVVAGACEALYLKDCLNFLAGLAYEVEVRCRTDSSAGRGITQRLGCGRVRHLQVGMLWIQQSVKKKELAVGTIPGSRNPSDLGTKPLGGPRVRELLCLMGARTPDHERYGVEDMEEAEKKRELGKVLKELKNSGAKANNVKAMLPLLVLMMQATSVQGLSWVTPVMGAMSEEMVVQLFATAIVGMIGLFFLLGVPYGIYKLGKWILGCCGPPRGTTSSQGVQTRPPAPDIPKSSRDSQANLGMSPSETKFLDEYVRRCRELESLVFEKCREAEAYEEELRNIRREHRNLQERFEIVRARRVPTQLRIASNRGIRFHLPTCGHIANSATKTYTPCADCIGQGGF